LRQTLGRYFNTYQTAPRTARADHKHFALQSSDLVVVSRGRMRAYSGLAYVPGLVPAGVTPAQMQ
jgi:Protein of unknown function (DUF2844)